MGHIDSECEIRHAITEVIASTNGEHIREPTPGSTLVRPSRHFSFTFANCDEHAFLQLISHLAQKTALALNFQFARARCAQALNRAASMWSHNER
jgi:hypothetical protein